MTCFMGDQYTGKHMLHLLPGFMCVASAIEGYERIL